MEERKDNKKQPTQPQDKLIPESSDVEKTFEGEDCGLLDESAKRRLSELSKVYCDKLEIFLHILLSEHLSCATVDSILDEIEKADPETLPMTKDWLDPYADEVASYLRPQVDKTIDIS